MEENVIGHLREFGSMYLHEIKSSDNIKFVAAIIGLLVVYSVFCWAVMKFFQGCNRRRSL